MSALPKPPSLLDPIFGKAVRTKLQWEERRLRHQMNLPKAKAEDLIANIILELTIALQNYTADKGAWNTYAYRVIWHQLARYHHHPSNCQKAENAEIPLEGKAVAIRTRKKASRKNRVERQRCLALGVKRVMGKMRRENREPLARLVLKDVKSAAKEYRLAQVQLRRKMQVLKEKLEAEGIEPSDAA